MMRKLLAALLLVALTGSANAGSITVLDGNGNPQTYQVFTNPAGNFLGSIVTCDPTSTANCIGINSNGQQTVIIVPVGQPNDSAAASGSVSGSVISILKGILTNVISPINVTGSFSVSSPLGVNIAATTPLNVTVASSPLNVTGNLTVNPTGQNIAQLAGQTLASPSTYGIAPVGSVQGINAFVTNQPTVVLSGSPVSVGLPATPLNVTVGGIVSPQGVTIAGPTPLNVTVGNTASPAGVAVVNNASVTPPTPLQVTFPASPISVGISATPLNVSLVAIPGSPQAVTVSATPIGTYLVVPAATSVVAMVATSAYNITGSAIQVATAGPHQLGKVYCAAATAVATPATAFLQMFDAATAGAVTVGTTLAKEIVAISGTPVQQTGFTNMSPGDQYSSGIVVAFTQGAFKSATAVGVNLHCTFAYN